MNVYKFHHHKIQMGIEKIIEKLQKLAVKNGANSTKIITAKNIFVEDWVRQKCEYGCKGYARHFTCPPYSPAPHETRKRLQNYETALLVEFANLKEKKEQQEIHKIMYELEKTAFLDGLHKSFAYTAGPCRSCGSCHAENIENPGAYSKKECKNQKMARPSMEACGIDVFQTARNAGYEIRVVKQETECFKSFGLLLLE